MEPNIWGRNNFCWLDDKRVVVFSSSDIAETSQCELLDTVSTHSKVSVDAGSFFRTFRRIFLGE